MVLGIKRVGGGFRGRERGKLRNSVGGICKRQGDMGKHWVGTQWTILKISQWKKKGCICNLENAMAKWTI